MTARYEDLLKGNDRGKGGMLDVRTLPPSLLPSLCPSLPLFVCLCVCSLSVTVCLCLSVSHYCRRRRCMMSHHSVVFSVRLGWSSNSDGRTDVAFGDKYKNGSLCFISAIYSLDRFSRSVSFSLYLCPFVYLALVLSVCLSFFSLFIFLHPTPLTSLDDWQCVDYH